MNHFIDLDLENIFRLSIELLCICSSPCEFTLKIVECKKFKTDWTLSLAPKSSNQYTYKSTYSLAELFGMKLQALSDSYRIKFHMYIYNLALEIDLGIKNYHG